MDNRPLVSIITPVYNSGRYLRECLGSILNSSYRKFEVIVVDDGSTDDSLEIAESFGINVIKLDGRNGPAAARNRGAKEARGDLLLFVDADVVIKKDSIARIVDDFFDQPQVAAVFGSYDDEPAAADFFSQYKNLLHHFVHQQGRSEAATFWAGCGAIRKEVFLELDGFDQERYKAPSIEDIELGYRMVQKGLRIFLDKKLQVKHLKKWSLKGLLRADIFYRAIPWARLILDSGGMVNDLNLKKSQRISAGLVGLALFAALLSLFRPGFIYITCLALLAVCGINHKLYRFFINRRGLKFGVVAIALHCFYYIYSSMAFAYVWLLLTVERLSKCRLGWFDSRS